MGKSKENMSRGMNTKACSSSSLKHRGATMELLKALECSEHRTFNNSTLMEFVPLHQWAGGRQKEEEFTLLEDHSISYIPRRIEWESNPL